MPIQVMMISICVVVDKYDSEVFKRPIFKVIERLLDIHATNHQPVDTNML